MNGIFNFLVSLGTFLVLGGICAFLVHLNTMKEELWEPIWNDFKSEEKEI